MSNYTKATNFTAKDSLPTGDSGKIVKGTEIDTELTAVASAIASKSDSNSPTFTGTPTAPTASAGTNTTQIATTAFVTTAVAAGVPSGVIVMWSGSIASIPSGWYLCNGSNGTPDLRDKFVVGAGSTYSVGGTGGSADAVVVEHNHTATSTSTVNDPGHSHTYTRYSSLLPQAGFDTNCWTGTSTQNTSTKTTGITVATTTTVASTGSSGTNANLPPYYALAYIMKA
jgi:hypothetical protein